MKKVIKKYIASFSIILVGFTVIFLSESIIERAYSFAFSFFINFSTDTTNLEITIVLLLSIFIIFGILVIGHEIYKILNNIFNDKEE